MPTLQSLPPLFLLPSWSKSQLLHLHSTYRATDHFTPQTARHVSRRQVHTADGGNGTGRSSGTETITNEPQSTRKPDEGEKSPRKPINGLQARSKERLRGAEQDDRLARRMVQRRLKTLSWVSQRPAERFGAWSTWKASQGQDHEGDANQPRASQPGGGEGPRTIASGQEKQSDGRTDPKRQKRSRPDRVARDARNRYLGAVRPNPPTIEQDYPPKRSYRSYQRTEGQIEPLRSFLVPNDKRSGVETALFDTPETNTNSADGKSAKLPSLYDELFPNEARYRKEPDYSSDDFLSNLPLLDIVSKTPHPTPEPRDDHANPSSPLQHARWKEDKVVVLFVSGASSDLSAADFHRLIPRGSHIASWRSPGQFLRIIPGRSPGRDPNILSPRRWYILVFGNPASARAYRDAALRAHAIARQYTPISLLSPPLPNKGDIVRGEPVHQIVTDYALYPATAEPDMHLLAKQELLTLHTLLERKGYAPLGGTEEDPKAGRSVKLWVDGYRPSENQIVGMLARNGRDRGMQWTPLDGSGVGEMTRLYDSSAENVERGQGQPLYRWLLSFRDEAEARRFVRTWHLRPFRLPPDLARKLEGEPLPKVHAEFLW